MFKTAGVIVAAAGGLTDSRQIRRHTDGFIVFVCAMVCAGASASAQYRTGSMYAMAGIGLFQQDGPSGESPQTYVTAPGGKTRGWMVGGGVFVANFVSLEAEFSRTGVMRSRQPSRYGMTFNEERRDQFVSFAGRFHFPAMGAFRVEPIVGIVITKPQASSQTDYYMFWLTPQQRLVIGPRLEHRLDAHLGVTFGCDVRVGGRRVGLLPSFRVSDTRISHGFYDDSTADRSEISSIYPGGYPKWTMRAGVGVRVDF